MKKIRKILFILLLVFITYVIYINHKPGVPIENRSLFSPEKAQIKKMEKLKRKSSFIDEMYFSPNYLIVEIDNKYYEYCNFNSSRWSDMKEVKSVGGTFNSRIKGKYSCAEHFKEKYIDIWGKDEGYYEITGEIYEY